MNMTRKHEKPVRQSGRREVDEACARPAGEGPDGNLGGQSGSEVTEELWEAEPGDVGGNRSGSAFRTLVKTLPFC